ncbi:hypothetical protein [Streptosporangium amethystogenes]|uniref:hypothetical protein n=1 Tax=Streptosporangium amethystogenes TaxID=2002 RepID=UPI0004CAC9DA|nr:hypothetical protein [Streptosporangium amethystogenes]
MTQPLLGQRSRGELIAELYDRHAAGLYAYSHDQLGSADSAFDVLVTVLSSVTDTHPPRAALYALARREIFLRDIVYSPPVTGLDPVPALVERVLSELRTHQREVLYLSGVCEMNAAELSWVLDVAVDTADELTVSACRRFAQSLGAALASARIPAHLTEVFGALAVAPVRDVLVLAPWAGPPSGLRAAVLGPRAPLAPAPRRSTSPLVRQLWPTSPGWPPSPENGTPAFPVPDHMAGDRFPDPFAPRDPEVVSAHEASTEPLPKLGESVLTALDSAALRPRRRLQRPRPRRAAPLSAPIPGDVLDDAPVRENLFRPLSPEARAARVYTDRLVAAAPRPEAVPPDPPADPLADSAPVETPRAPSAEALLPGQHGDVLGDVLDDAPTAHPLPGWPLQTDQLDALSDAERHRPLFPVRAAQAETTDSETGRVQPPMPTWATPAPAPDPETGRVQPPMPAWVTDPVQPAAVNWFADAAPSGTETGTEFGSTTDTQDETSGEPLTPLPAWSPRPDHLSTPADRAQLRLPSWIMRVDQPEDAPRHTVPPNYTAPQERTPMSYDAQWSESTIARGGDSGAETGEAGTAESGLRLSGRAGSRRHTGRRAARRHKAQAKVSHRDWAWEVIGFIIAVAIAMIVFFAVPMITTP